tara:strand:- start:5697 stop:6509 length:813 start_codon:yes stop_codon:yes gene_type:complete
MPVPLANYTLTYDTDARIQGWPSFYSYAPDYMVGMNSFFYSFSGGNLYRHSVNPVRNNFYGVQYNSTVTTPFNSQPLDNKLYKTLALQGAEAWAAQMVTDIQTSLAMPADFFEVKEQTFFAFVRNQDANVNFSLRSAQGIGFSIGINPTVPTAVVVEFQQGVSLSGINGTPVSGTNVGDMLYFGTGTPTLAGQITAVNVNPQAGINELVVDTTVTGGNMPTQPSYFLVARNQIAESHGVLGHYALTTLTHPGTTQGELFAVQSDVMKSYP